MDQLQYSMCWQNMQEQRNSEILGVSRWTLSKAVKEGTVKAVVLRKWPRISEEELKRLTAPKEEPKEFDELAER